MPERMVAELAEVACGVPSGSLGWWCGHPVLVGGCHAVLLGGGVPYGSSGWQRHKNKKTDTVLVVSNALIQNKLITSPPTCYS